MSQHVETRLRTLRVLLAVGILAIVGTVAHAETSDAADLPAMLRQDLEGVLKKKIADLLAQKDESGNGFKRGSYSKNFKKVDDSTYQVVFHQDTAGNDRLKSERLLLTLKKDGSGKWAVAKEDLQDTYDGLYRGVVGDEQFFKFDKLSFDREGLKVTATNGSLYKDFFNGKTSRFVIVAPDLAYDYAPPTDLSLHQLHMQVLLKEYGEDLVVKPYYATIQCFPASCDELESSIFTGLRKVGAAETDSKLQTIYDDAKKEYEKGRKENPFLGFRRLPEEDRRAYTVSLKRDSLKDYWVWLSYDNYDPKEVSFSTSKRGPIYTYYAEEVRKSGIPPYDLEHRDDADARDYEIDSLKGTVELALEDPGTVAGDITYGMTIKRELRELPFRIARLRFPGAEEKEAKNPKLFVNSIQDGDGNELTWVKTGPFSGLVVFPKSLAAGSEIVLRMNFVNSESIYSLNPTYSYVDRGGWLPFVRFGDLIDELDLTVKVPDRFTALGIGKRVSETKKDGVSISKWVADSPVDFPTVIFGDYVTAEPGIKATKIDGTEIPVRVYVDKVSTHALNTAFTRMEDVQDLVNQQAAGARDIRPSQLKALAEQAVNALNLYKSIYGIDYPYGKLDLVNDPLGFLYGQSPASIIYLGAGVFRGEGVIGSETGESETTKFLKDVVAHETGHQWWGSAISNANFGNYWFVESLAEYSSALFVENVYGRKRYDEKVAAWRRFLLKWEMLTSVQGATSSWGGEFPGAAYIANVYNKGPYAFHILRQTFGDEKFFRFLKMMATELNRKEIVTRDIQQIMEKAYGVNMDWFFDQWLRGVGLPQYALNYTSRKTEDGKYLVEGTIKQRVIVGKQNIELPGVYYRAVAPLTFVTAGGKELKSAKPILVQGAETPFKLKIAEEPVEVYFNKDGEILAQDVLVNRSW